MPARSDAPVQTKWVAVIALATAIVMVALDLTVVAVALPTIGENFNTDPAVTQWMVLAYTLPLVALMIPAGRWLDGSNPRHAFILAVVGFAIASLLVAVAPTFEIALAARALQGAFGAIIGALILVVAARVVNPLERGKAFGIIALVAPLGSVLGPGLGGVLVATVGWRAIFLINVPVCVAAVALAWMAIPSEGRLNRLRPTLLVDAGLGGSGALLFVLGLNGIAQDGVSPTVIGMLALAVATITVWSRLPTTAPVTGALKHASLTRYLAALLLHSAMVNSLFFLMPFLLQHVLNTSPSEAGFVLLAMPLALAATSQVGGRAADRFGPRNAGLAGAAMTLLAALLLLPLDPAWSAIDVAWRLSLVGVGSAFFVPANQSAIVEATNPRLMGTVSALSGLFRNLGFTLGPAVAVILWVGRDYTPEAMRPSFLLVGALPLAVLATLLLAPGDGSRSMHEATLPGG